MSLFLKNEVVSRIFSTHTACYGAPYASKRPCDRALVTALLAECGKLPRLRLRGIVAEPIRSECRAGVHGLSLTMDYSVRSFVLPVLNDTQVRVLTQQITFLVRRFLEWHQSKWDSITAALQCKLDYDKLRSKGCLAAPSMRPL